MITRTQYMNESHAEHIANLEAGRKNREGYNLGAPIAHQRYYGQFVTDSVKSMVAQAFTIPALVEADAQELHFNSISLRRWDWLASALPRDVVRVIAQANGTGGVSLSDRVCVLKAAARMIVDEQEASK